MAIEIPDAWIRGASLRPGEVADIFNVDRVTVTRWADQGMIGYFRTPNGDRRYPIAEVKRVVNGTEPPPDFLPELVKKDREKWREGRRQRPFTEYRARKMAAEREKDAE